jgi:hypothetical protein
MMRAIGAALTCAGVAVGDPVYYSLSGAMSVEEPIEWMSAIYCPVSG